MLGSARMWSATGNKQVDSYGDYIKSRAPIAYWRYNEPINSLVSVDEMSTYNGSYIGNPTLRYDSLLVGNGNTSIVLDGVNDYIDYGIINSTADFACSFILKTADTTIRHVFSNWDGGTNDRSLLIELRDGTIHFLICYDGITEIRLTSTTIINNSSINSFVVQYKPSISMEIYINGLLDISLTTGIYASTKLTASTCKVGTIGNSPSVYLSGAVDEISIYDRILTGTEITNIYQKAIGN